MSFLRAAWIVARKDLRISFRDRIGMLLGFALPVGLCATFGFVSKFMAGGDGGFSRTTLWVADADRTGRSAEFVAALRDSSVLRVRPDPDEGDDPVDEAQLRRKLADGEIHHGLVVPAGFAESLARSELPSLRLLRDPDREIEEQLISVGLMQAIFATLGPDYSALLTTRGLELAGVPAEWRARTLALATTFQAGVESLFREREDESSSDEAAAKEPERREADDGFDLSEIMGQIVPVEHVDFRPPERPKQLTYMLAQSVSGITVMMLLFGLVACAQLLIRERENATLARLLVAPNDRSAILWGKFLFTAVTGAMQLVILFVFGAIVFHVDVLRDLPTFLAISASVLAAATSFGMLVATWARTSKQAEGVSTLVILVMSALGGAWFPLQMLDLSTPVRVVMGCTLTHWAMQAYQGLFWHGHDLADGAILTSVLVLWGFTIGAGLLARRLFATRYVGA